MFTNVRTKLSKTIIDLRTYRHFTREQERGVAVLLALVACGAGLILLLHRTATPAIAAPAPIAIPAQPTVAQTLVIDVEGKVLHPGVYTLPKGSRAVDALSAAGNSLKGVDLSDINLAHLLVDGEEIIVGAPKIIATGRSKGSASKIKKSSTSSGSISINTSSAAQLESLPGVGPVMAGRIIAYRLAHGAFTALDQLRKVSGMGAAKYGAIQSLIHL
jgi:competence protein ComEA